MLAEPGAGGVTGRISKLALRAGNGMVAVHENQVLCLIYDT